MIRKTEEYKPVYLEQAKQIIQDLEDKVPNDGYPIDFGDWNGRKPEWGPMGKILERGIDECVKLFGSRYNNIWYESWVNVVRPNPRQTYQRHNHVEINNNEVKPLPAFTWVYYLQMPSPVFGDEGKLEIEDIVGDKTIIERVMPEVGDIIILRGDQYHTIMNSPNSTVNRIVIAGNVAFQNIKQTNTLM